MQKIVIIDYKAGNIFSVNEAFKRLEINPIISDNPEVISSADKIVFPGVGHAKTAMEALQKRNLDKLIPQLKMPVLGICLGMQLMCNKTEEGHTEGLGIFDVNVKEFQSKTMKVPHMGWNQLTELKGSLMKNITPEEYVYFVHTFYAEMNDYSIGNCNYILDFSAALEKDNFFATQFHPEKSGKVGEQILKNFINL